jgi:hypothetical protein
MQANMTTWEQERQQGFDFLADTFNLTAPGPDSQELSRLINETVKLSQDRRP